MSALPPPAALALAVRLLEARGFAVSARNERGDSVYLTKPLDTAMGATAPIPSPLRGWVRGGGGAEGTASPHPEPPPPPASSPQGGGEGRGMPGGSIGSAAPAIRVSNHSRTPKQRRKHPEVATSLVIRAPKTPAQVAAMVEAALRMVKECPAAPG